MNIEKRIYKILSIISFSIIIFLLTNLIVIKPATKYEFSIYDMIPLHFWILIIFTLMIGNYLLLTKLIKKNSDNNYWKLGFFISFFISLIILFIPLIRGYLTFGRGDHLTHIGMIRDILTLNHFGQYDFYPNLHLFSAISKIITDIDIIQISNIIPRFFYIPFPIFFYVLLKNNLKNKFIYLPIIFCGSFLFFSSFSNYLAQCPQSFFLTPLLLYIFLFKYKSKYHFKFSILFLLSVISYILYHPLNSLLLLIFILSFAFLVIIISSNSIIKTKFENNFFVSNFLKYKGKLYSDILIFLSTFIIWYFSFSIIIKSFKIVLFSIFYSFGTSSSLEMNTAIVSKYNPMISDLIRVFIFNYGLYLLMGILSILSIILIFLKKKTIIKKHFLFTLVLSVVTFFIYGLFSAISFLTNTIVGWKRFIRWNLFFSFILVGISFTFFLFDENIKKKFKFFPTKKIKISLVFIILIIVSFLSLFTYFQAPINNGYNYQVTRVEWSGMNWLFEEMGSEKLIQSFRINPYRFADSIYGFLKGRDKLQFQKISTIQGNNPGLPDDLRFYENYSYINKSIKNYIVLNQLGKEFYPNLHPNYEEMWRFNDNDFKRIQHQKVLNSIYNSKTFEIYLEI